jgi:hypothetical protein
MKRQGDPPWAAGVHPGKRRRQAAAFAASFGRESYGAAAAALGFPVTGGLRFPPYLARTASPVPRPGRHPRAECAGSREDVTASGPRIIRAGPSSVKGTRRSFLTAPQKRSSGPALERRRPLPAQRA